MLTDPPDPPPNRRPAKLPSLAEEDASLAPLPLPLVGGKRIAVTPGQRNFNLPLGFARVATFYRDQFRGVTGVTLTERPPKDGPRELSIRSLRSTDAWASAVVCETETGTVVKVTPVLRFATQKVQGVAKPLVEFAIGRSEEARRAAESIDHLQR